VELQIFDDSGGDGMGKVGPKVKDTHGGKEEEHFTFFHFHGKFQALSVDFDIVRNNWGSRMNILQGPVYGRQALSIVLLGFIFFKGYCRTFPPRHTSANWLLYSV
jgi:hypothetical protein